MLIIPLKTLIIIQKLQKLKIKDVILVIQSKKVIIIQKLSIFKVPNAIDTMYLQDLFRSIVTKDDIATALAFSIVDIKRWIV